MACLEPDTRRVVGDLYSVRWVREGKAVLRSLRDKVERIFTHLSEIIVLFPCLLLLFFPNVARQYDPVVRKHVLFTETKLR